MVMIVIKMVLLCCLLMGMTNPASAFQWPEGWSEITPLFNTGLQGHRYVVQQDQHGISTLSVDGVYQEDLQLNYRLYHQNELLVEDVIARGNINYPNFFLDDQGIRHLLWLQRM